MRLYTYLNYGGMMTHGQGPNPGNVPPDWENAVLHARMNVGETELLGADISTHQPMRSAYLALIVSSNDEAERICAALPTAARSSCP